MSPDDSSLQPIDFHAFSWRLVRTSKHAKHERNWMILAEYDAGATQASLALKYGISNGRVSDIIAKYRRLLKRLEHKRGHNESR